MYRLVLVVVLAVASAVFATAAQVSAPVARQNALFRVQGAGPMAFVGDDWLVVTVGTSLQVFDVSEPATPFDLATVALGSAPLAVGATSEMALVAVARDDAVDEIVVVTADPFRQGTPGIVNSLQVSEAVHTIVTSPDTAWAVALGADGYHVLRLTGPSVIESSALVRTPGVPSVGALAADSLLVAFAEEDRIDRYPLRVEPGLPSASASRMVENAVSALAVTPDGSLAVVALENDVLLLLDAVTLDEVGRIVLEDGPVRALHVAAVDTRNVLIVQIENRPAVMLLDVTQPDQMSLPGSAGAGDASSVHSSTASGSLFALASEDTIGLLTLE